MKLLIAQNAQTFKDGELIMEGATALPVNHVYHYENGTGVFKEDDQDGATYITVVDLADPRSLNIV